MLVVVSHASISFHEHDAHKLGQPKGTSNPQVHHPIPPPGNWSTRGRFRPCGHKQQTNKQSIGPRSWEHQTSSSPPKSRSRVIGAQEEGSPPQVSINKQVAMKHMGAPNLKFTTQSRSRVIGAQKEGSPPQCFHASTTHGSTKLQVHHPIPQPGNWSTRSRITTPWFQTQLMGSHACHNILDAAPLPWILSNPFPQGNGPPRKRIPIFVKVASNATLHMRSIISILYIP